MGLEIIWTIGAERDLLEIYQQILFFADDEDFARRALQLPLESNLRLISEHPEIGPKVRGTRKVRRRLLTPRNRYGIYYIVESRGILIHALLDLRQDPRLIWKRLS